MPDVHFILVEPKVSENVGAAARALNTMGFESLRLVTPCDHLNDRARTLAHGSIPILETATVYDTLEDALTGIDVAVATTARRRRLRCDYYDASDLRGVIERKGDMVGSVGLVFGPEERGLRSEEILRCDLTTMIPMSRTYPSLNLAQSVMVYAYELSPLKFRNARRTQHAPTQGELLALHDTVRDLLQHMGFKEGERIYHRILERIGLMEQLDVHLLHSVCAKLGRMVR